MRVPLSAVCVVTLLACSDSDDALQLMARDGGPAPSMHDGDEVQSSKPTDTYALQTVPIINQL